MTRAEIVIAKTIGSIRGRIEVLDTKAQHSKVHSKPWSIARAQAEVLRDVLDEMYATDSDSWKGAVNG